LTKRTPDGNQLKTPVARRRSLKTAPAPLSSSGPTGWSVQRRHTSSSSRRGPADML
jgi:hypothetical protein